MSHLRLPVEKTFAEELEALKAVDDAPKPVGWMLSPQAVVTYILGGKAGETEIAAFGASRKQHDAPRQQR